jgi:hypothetical protein
MKRKPAAGMFYLNGYYPQLIFTAALLMFANIQGNRTLWTESTTINPGYQVFKPFRLFRQNIDQ